MVVCVCVWLRHVDQDQEMTYLGIVIPCPTYSNSSTKSLSFPSSPAPHAWGTHSYKWVIWMKAASSTAFTGWVSPGFFSECHNASLLSVVRDNRLQSYWLATSFLLKTMRTVKEKTVTWAIRWLGVANNLFFRLMTVLVGLWKGMSNFGSPQHFTPMQEYLKLLIIVQFQSYVSSAVHN